MPEQKRGQTAGAGPEAIATVEDYVQVFEGFAPGRKVLEDLLARFHDRPIHVAGGIEGQRETEKRAAQKEVVGFILRRVGQIHEREESNAG